MMVSTNARFTKKGFLAYHKFKDEPESVPQIFIRDKGTYEKLIEDVVKDVKAGVKLIDALRFNAGVSKVMAYKWRNDFFKELDEGKTDTPLIRLFSAALKSDATLHRKVMSMVMDKAEDGDTTAIIYLAKHRLGYNSATKQEVELSSKEEAPVKFVFADMKPLDAEKEEDDEL